jgi:EAL domain-containing protein (putative c-di-GMP-specific phosphodiesterase class I)
LRSFPFDKIKIDRSFINDVSMGDANAIVQATTSIASTMKMTTTAEGVETQEQLDVVRALGCTEMQGFLFSKAKPAAELASQLLPQHAPARSVA